MLFLFFVLLLVWCFLDSASFLLNALRHLGIVFSSLLCPHADSSTSCLGCPFVSVGFWAAFYGNPLSTLNMTGRRFHRTTEAIPRRPWKAKRLFRSRPVKIEGYARVRTRYDGTSSIHFHRAVPRSSSHTGPRLLGVVWAWPRGRGQYIFRLSS